MKIIFPFAANQAVEGGATVLFGDADTKQQSTKPGAGYYVSPTILSEVSDENEAWTSEIFGPVRLLSLLMVVQSLLSTSLFFACLS